MLSLICLIHIHLEEVTYAEKKDGDEGVRHSDNPLSTFNHIKRVLRLLLSIISKQS